MLRKRENTRGRKKAKRNERERRERERTINREKRRK